MINKRTGGERRIYTLWHSARLRTASRSLEDMSLRPRVASCAPVAIDPDLAPCGFIDLSILRFQR